MKYGERNFRIISPNVDNLRNYEAMGELDVRTNNKKADIVCIQETHSITDNGRNLDNYKIYFPKAEGVVVVGGWGNFGNSYNGFKKAKWVYF